MNVIFYPDSVRKNVNLFGDLFNEIPINRRNKNTLETYNIPIQLGNKSKLLAFIRSNKKSQYSIKLPCLGYNIESIDYDEERQINPLSYILSEDNSQYVFQPVPYTFSFILGIYAGSTTDIFRIFEYIVPQYRKTRYVNLKEFEFIDGSAIERKIPVTLQNSLNNMRVEDIGSEDEMILKLDLSFTQKGWIYSPIEGVSNDSSNIDWRTNNTIESTNGNLGTLIENIKANVRVFDDEDDAELRYEQVELSLSTGDDIVEEINDLSD